MITVRRTSRPAGAEKAPPVEPVPPEPPASRPRPVRLSGTGRFVVFIAVLLTVGSAAGGSALLARAVRDRDLRRQIAADSVSTRAVVVGLTRTRGDDPRYIVSYAYGAAGRTFQGRRAIRRAEWSRLRIGSAVDVRYLPTEASESWIAGYEPRGLPFWLGPVLSLGFALSAWAVWHELRKQWMLLSEGRPALARVTGSKRTVGRQAGRSHEVSYEFRLLSGAARTGKFTVEKAPPPPEGSPVRIIYDPDNPGRSSRYPLSLVRIA